MKTYELKEQDAFSALIIIHGYFPRSTIAEEMIDIINREGIAVRRMADGAWRACYSDDLGYTERPAWTKHTYDQNRAKVMKTFTGSTMQEAALRAYAYHCLGEEITL